jgi:hypothetical protein
MLNTSLSRLVEEIPDSDSEETMTEQILNGDFCQDCGMWLGVGDGHPRQCHGCRV